MTILSARDQRQLDAAKADCKKFIEDNTLVGYDLLRGLAADALQKGYRFQIVGYARLYLTLRVHATENKELESLLRERYSMYTMLAATSL